MEHIKLSVIIPCYNGFKYMNKCFHAFEQQKRKDFELVIVDDASTDDTYEQLKKYKKTSLLNIKILHNERNVGPGKSRGIAKDYCRGKYIGFCDCDDWLDEDYVKEVIEIMDRENSDFCMFNNYRVNGDKLSLDNVISTLAKVNDKREILAYAPMSLCRIVVSKNLLEQVDFYNLYYGEDGIVLLQLMIKMNKPIFLEKPFYYYLMRQDATHATPSKRCFSDAVEGYEMLKQYMEPEFHEELVFTGIKNIIYAGTLQAFKSKINRSDFKKVLTQFKRENPQYINNKYIVSLNIVKKLYVKLIYYKFYRICSILAIAHNYIMGK